MSKINDNKTVQSYLIGEMVLIPEGFRENHALVLNDVATKIWEKIETDRSTTLESICQLVLDEYSSTRDQVVKDVRIFIECLTYMNIISVDQINYDDLEIDESDNGQERAAYRPPKIYVYDLDTSQEVSFGPHIRGQSNVHRAITRGWHGGCC
ncbi:PqqD family protein [Desulfovibrio sp. Huiquan2017]|uniref:PqqD family protein n=1 Tax=Desulfovibrio sp. Huiquan2017 TaxID=2816861 RepID=UPI001A9231C1|nr:PqqD family protein [Desulfovibrio sp. Huiquan2017]